MVVTTADSKVKLATEVAFARAMEGLAADLAVYLATGINSSAESGREAVTRLLERMLETQLDMYLEEFGLSPAEVREASANAALCLAKSVQAIQRTAIPEA